VVRLVAPVKTTSGIMPRWYRSAVVAATPRSCESSVEDLFSTLLDKLGFPPGR
jgi:hypothetical protein